MFNIHKGSPISANIVEHVNKVWCEINMKLNTIWSYHRDVESRLWSRFYLLFCDETLKSNVCQRLSELAAFFVFQNEFLTPVFVYSSTPDQLVSCITFPVLLYSFISLLLYSCIYYFVPATPSCKCPMQYRLGSLGIKTIN